jgi:hypothetical protein
VAEPLCTRCGTQPRRPRQRWCATCAARYKREARNARRVTGNEAGNGIAGIQSERARESEPGETGRVVRAGQGTPEKGRPTPPPPAPYVPFAGADAPREPWYSVFLADLAVNGGISLAVAAAGVHRSLVYRRIADDSAFAEEVKVAEAYYRDHLEWESVNLARRKDNPLPFFARLKAELPARYIDRQAVLIGTVEALDPEEGRALLRAMLDLPPAEGALEAAGPDPARVVLDGEPSGPESAQTAE